MKSIDEISRNLTGLSFEEADRALALFDSYCRTTAMILVMSRAPSPRDCLTTFLNWGNVCDAPWPHRSHIADRLRWACSEASLVDLLTNDALKFYEALPSLIQVWRGCERGRERGLSWTLDRDVAKRFATGQRCINGNPTLVKAQIPKEKVFAVFVDRNESELALDPRRLKKLTIELEYAPISTSVQRQKI
jgi:hypothetical protein